MPIASLPGMRERTVTISSSGKTFSLTGWKIGWSCAAPELTAAVRAVHQFVTFAVATPFQHAVASGLAAPDAYYRGLRDDYRSRRDRLCEGLEAAGFEVRRPEGTYFALADMRPLGYEDGRGVLPLARREGRRRRDPGERLHGGRPAAAPGPLRLLQGRRDARRGAAAAAPAQGLNAGHARPRRLRRRVPGDAARRDPRPRARPHRRRAPRRARARRHRSG